MINLHYGDCMELMQHIIDSSVDLIFTDPPYYSTNLHFDKADKIDLLAWLNECKRVLKPYGVLVCFVDLNLLITLKNLKKFSSSYILIWHKTMPTGFLNCNIRPLQAHEYIAVFVDGLKKSTYNPQKKLGKPYIKSSKKDNRMTHMRENRAIKTVSLDGMRHPTTILHFPNSNSCSKHPTAKPIALCEWIVKTYSNAGDTILDPFMGSGAVGKAANNIGRHFIGMEIHEPYYLSAIELINGPD